MRVLTALAATAVLAWGGPAGAEVPKEALEPGVCSCLESSDGADLLKECQLFKAAGDPFPVASCTGIDVEIMVREEAWTILLNQEGGCNPCKAGAEHDPDWNGIRGVPDGAPAGENQ